MNSEHLAHQRLRHQQIAGATFSDPRDVVAWMGAIQAQDYLGALWAIGLRTHRATERAVEAAIADKAIVRTWPMRGTLHFVAAEDVRWMIELLAPRVVARSAGRRRQLGLDDTILQQSAAVISAALEGGKQLLRTDLYQVLEHANIAAAGQRGLHILGYLAQQSLICFGPRAGKQPTFVLLDEWVPHARRLEREAALAELTQRYFTSHGPATVQDLMWWSGLSAADVNAGLALAGSQLVCESVAGRAYWLPHHWPAIAERPAPITLLPAFDEYVLGYRDRSAILDPRYKQHVQPGSNGMFSPTIVRDGQVIGTWRRTLKQRGLVVTAAPFEHDAAIDADAFAGAAQRYAQFLGKPLLQP